MFTLHMRRWLCHTDRELRLSEEERLAFVVGEGGAGKSSILLALEFVLLGTGHLRNIRTKKALGAYAIQDGHDECSVQLVCDDTTVTRSMKRSGAQRLFIGDDEVGPGHEVFPAPPDVIRLALDPFEWFHLEETRQRELLIEATSAGRGMDQTAISERLCEAIECPTDPMPASVSKLAAMVAQEGFRAAEAEAVEQRKAAKRARADISVPDLPETHIDGIPVDGSGTPVEHDQELFFDLEAQHEAALRAAGASAAVLEGQLQEADATLQAALAAASEHDAKPAPEWRPLQTEFDEAGRDGAVLATKLEVAEKAHREATDRITSAAAALPPEAEGFEHPGQCPVAAGMRCPAAKATFEKHLLAVAEERDRQVAALEAEKAETLPPLLQAVEEARAAHEEQQATIRDLARRLEFAKAEAMGYTAEAKRLAGLVEAASDRVNALYEKLKEARVAETTDGDAPKHEALAARLELGHRVIAAKVAYKQALEDREAANRAIQRANAAVAMWDALAKALAPEGIETDLGADAASTFADRLAGNVLGEIELGPDLEFRARVDGEGDWRHPLQLSTSQRMGLGVAIQHAFARSIRFPILVCDAIDTFDGPHRDAWTEFAAGVAHEYSAVLGLATILGDPSPPGQGMVTFWLNGGEMTPLRDAKGF